MPRPRKDPESPSVPLHGEHGQNQSVTITNDAQLEQLANAPDPDDPELSPDEYKLIVRELEHEKRRAHKSR